MQGKQLENPNMRRKGWLVWASCGMMFFLGFESAGLQLALLRVAGEFVLGPAMMGLLASAQYFALLVVQPIFGVIADRTGKKQMAVGSVLVFALGCLLTAASGGALSFLCGIFIVGIGYSLAESMSTAALADAFPDKASRYMSLTQALFCTGAVISPLITDWLISGAGFSWRIAFIISAAGHLLLFPFLLATPFAKLPQAAAPGGQPQPKASLRHILILPFFALLLSILLYGGTETSTASFVDARFAVGLNAPELGVFALSLYWFAMMASCIVFAIVKVNTQKAVLALTLTVAAAQLGLALTRSGLPALAFVFVIGFAMGPLWAMLVSIAAQEYPRNSGTAVSLMAAGSGTGGALLPLVSGAVMGVFGVPAVYIVTTLSAGGSALIFVAHLRLVAARKRKSLC